MVNCQRENLKELLRGAGCTIPTCYRAGSESRVVFLASSWRTKLELVFDFSFKIKREKGRSNSSGVLKFEDKDP